MPVKILHLEDNEEDAELIKRNLALTGVKFERLLVDNRSDFIKALKDFLPDIILSDHKLPGFNSSEALKICKINNYSGAFILVSREVSDDYGASIVKNEGAYDYVLKTHLQRLPSVINRALISNKLFIENQNCLDENTENVLLLKEAEKLAHLGSWQSDLKTNTIIWSDEAFRLYGYEPGEISASIELLLDHIHPEDLEFVRKMTARTILAKEENIKFSFRIIDKKGNLKYLHNETHIKRNKEGKPIRLTGFNLDISETIEVTKALEKRERLYKKLIEKSADMKIIRSADGIVLYGSPSIYNILGYTTDEFIGKSMLKIIHPEDFSKFTEMNDNLLTRPGESYYIEERLRHKNGTYRWCEGTVTNWMLDEDIEGFLGNFRDITERKENEIRIAESDKRYQELFDNSPMPTWILDANTYQFLKVNKAAINNYGYSLEEFMAMKAIDIKPVDEQEIFIKNIRTPGLYYARQIKKDGTVITVELNSNRIIFDGKEANLAIINDVTERIKAEEALKKSEANFQTIFDNTETAYIFLDKNLTVLAFNNIANNWAGAHLKTSLKLGINILEANYDSRKVTIADVIQTALGGESVRFEREYKQVTGELEWYYARFTPISNENDGIYGVIVSIDNITERKLSEIALQKSESNLQTIFDNTDIGYLLLDTELNVVSFNNCINEWTNVALGQNLFEGMNLGTFIENVKKGGNDLLGLLKNNIKSDNIDYESTFTDKQGKIAWYHVKYFPVLDGKGKDTGSILSLNDITAKKLAETEHEKMTEDLIHRNKDLEQFAYIVSHNLRAPVANILGSCTLMQDKEIEDEDKDLLLEELDTSIHKLDGVINDLNEILQTKKTMSETREIVVFSKLVSQIKSEIGNMMNIENVKIITDFSETDEMLTLKSYMRSVFLNLITNSIKYRRPGIAPLIQISAHKSKDHVRLIFKDNGLGINIAKYKDQIFGLYKRFHLKVEGKGMGLFMVKTHVETLGGTIRLKSEVNEGCEFVIDFKI